MLRVWRIDLDAERAADEVLAELLDAQERDRASRFVRAVDRRRFLVSHAALRRTLAPQCGVLPGALIFERNTFGKPHLAAPAGDLHFSLSHSASCALVAVAAHQEVGVDVEAIRPHGDLEGLARLIMTSREWTDWHLLPEGDRLGAFYACWTRKEAVLKAAGTGLGVDPASVETGLGGEGTTLAHHPAGTSWTVRGIEVSGGYAGAIAMQAVMPIEHFVLPPLHAA